MKNIFDKKFLTRLCALGVMLLGAAALSAQQVKIKGVVTDDKGEPMLGVTIIVKGTTQGAQTGVNGTYMLTAPKDGTLEFSYLGYQTVTERIANRTTIDVQMKGAFNTLDEIVVVGYGSMRKGDLTGSVSSVSGKSIETYKSGSVVEAMGGLIAGVQITQQDGTPGAGFDIKVRGIGTVTGDSSPLYVVDGFQVDDINYLANSDIESIEVLKDASASAIYGSRAANGVVLVTTKSGKVGRPVITYNGSLSYREISKKLDVLSPYEFVKLQMELNPTKYATTYFKEGNDADGNPYRYQTLNDYLAEGGVDWQSEVFKPTWSQNHDVSLQGGNNDTKYTLSFSDFLENGIFTNSSFAKKAAKARFNHKINKRVSFDFTINYTNIDKRGVGTSGDSGRFNMLAQIISARPTGGLALTNTQLLNEAIDPLELENSESLAQVNPIVQAESVNNNRKTDVWQGNLSVNVEIAKGLTFKSAGSYRLQNYRADIFYREGSKEAYRNGLKPYGQTSMGKDLRWSNFNYLTYKYRTKKQSLEAMLGQEITRSSSEYLLGQAQDFPFDNLGNNNLGLGATPSKVATDYAEKTLLSFFGRVNYSLLDRYLFTGTLRMDGSSVFSAKHKWGFFPSFSAAWRVNEEPFLKDVEFISNLKLRAGWGSVGNDRIASNLSLALYQSSKYGIGTSTTTVLTPKQLPNEDLRWEGSTTSNIGVDFGLFGSRLNLTVDLFVKNTKDLLLEKSLANVTGFSSQYQNIGKIKNKGLEISLNSVNIETKNFTWVTDFNISFIRNTLVALQEGETRLFARSSFDYNFTSNDYVAIIGRSLGLIYGYEFDGVYQYSDFDVDAATGTYVLKKGVTDISAHYGSKVQPGVVKYKDQNGDGVITDADRTVIGNATPDFYGGLTNTFIYRGFDASIILQYTVGNDLLNATRAYATQSDMERSNKLAEVADRWTVTNASDKVPSAAGYIRNDIYSRYVEDGSFLRLKNITFGYTLPQNVTKRFFVSSLRVYVTAQNLYTLTSYTGYDPEVSMRANNPMTPGVDWGAYPRSKVFTFGLDVKF